MRWMAWINSLIDFSVFPQCNDTGLPSTGIKWYNRIKGYFPDKYVSAKLPKHTTETQLHSQQLTKDSP